ncbi:MAG: prepilin-type N-terminal cleavage/methylation domain-containing protein [Elusimicrobiaceae bacterium]|nr:prepilin-type N-terminal cleavage/methylation domain-containing protein [Elusimicrobiaceae bacterium]
MKNKNKKNKKGFTLVEVLVAVLIVGILTAIAVPSYNFVVEKARATQGITTLSQIAKAQTAYNARRGNYSENMLGLPLDMKDQNGSDILGSEFADKYFDYVVYGNNEKASIARRNNGKYGLLVNYETGKIECFSEDETICAKLGLESGPGIQEDAGSPCSGGLADSLVYSGFEEWVSSYRGTCVVKNNVVQYTICEDENNWCEEGRIDADTERYCTSSDIELPWCTLYNNKTDVYIEKECLVSNNEGCEIWRNNTENDCVIYGDSWECSEDKLDKNIWIKEDQEDGSRINIYCLYSLNNTCLGEGYIYMEDASRMNRKDCIRQNGLVCEEWGEWHSNK